MNAADPALSSSDPLWRSLERILSFYQLRLDKKIAESQIAVDWSKPLAPADILLIARHLGLEVTVHAIAGIDIGSLSKPSLVLLPDKQSLVALPQDGKLPALWVPEGAVDIDVLCASRAKNLYVMEFDRPAAAMLRAEGAVAPIGWFWELLRRESRAYMDIGLATFFINLFMLITPLFSMIVFDRVVPNHAHETLTALTIGIVIAFIFNFGFKLIRGHALGAVVARVASRLDVDFMDHLLRLTIPAHKLTVGERFDLFHELQNLRDFFAARLIPALVDMPFFLLFLLVIYLIAPVEAVVTAVGVALLIAVNIACRHWVGRAAATAFRAARGKNAALVEMLAGATAIRMANAAGSRLFRWQSLAERGSESARRSQNAAGLADDLSMTIMSLISIFVIVVGVNVIETGDMSLGGLIACNILVARTLAPIMNIASVIGRLRQSMNQLRSIDAIFHLPAETRISADYEPKGPFTGAMALRDITFYHPGQVHPTLYRLTLNIRAGDKIGLIGRTGAGKSTVTRLLDGSLKPQSGHVFVDGLVLDAIHPAEWREGLGIVPQDPFIFAGSVRDNILLGINDTVDEDWLRQTLTMSGLDFLMQQAGYGLDFDVGEAGARLSGGQRQSVAIARALMRKPRILLLDEPTNGMDNDLELRVKTALQAYVKDKTMVLVTHRTSLLSMATRLVLIDQGGIAADGPPDDVMRRLSGGGAAHG
jgi:ATP-binding cassette subfamily B protein/ATP-binding cassette subfamily C protein LapB